MVYLYVVESFSDGSHIHCCLQTAAEFVIVPLLPDQSLESCIRLSNGHQRSFP